MGPQGPGTRGSQAPWILNHQGSWTFGSQAPETRDPLVLWNLVPRSHGFRGPRGPKGSCPQASWTLNPKPYGQEVPWSLKSRGQRFSRHKGHWSPSPADQGS